MASKEDISDNSALVSSAFSGLFIRKLQENLDRKNQNLERRIVIKTLKSVYAYEISCMMHTLGDVKSPLKKSVTYLETILRDQMNLLLIKASEVPGSKAGTKALTHAHLLSLLASNRKKMTRLLHYLFLKDSSQLLGKRKYEKFYDIVNSSQFGVKVKTCLQFLESIDAGDYDPETIKSVFDDVNLERIARKYDMACRMSNKQYLSFSKKQCVCFYPKNDDRFKKWLLADNVTHLQPTALALDILAFFARETVAEVVEAALLIRQPKELLNLDCPNVHINNNLQSKVDEADRCIAPDLDVPGSFFNSSGKIGLPNFITDCSDSPNFNSLVYAGELGMSDIFALSTSSLNEADLFSSSKESSCSKKRRIDAVVSFTKNNVEITETGEFTIANESRNKYNIPKPKIPARNPNDPITERDLKSAVMNTIFSSPGQIHMNKTKKILCL